MTEAKKVLSKPCNRRGFLAGVGAAGLGVVATRGKFVDRLTASPKEVHHSKSKALQKVTLTYGVATMTVTTCWFGAIPIGLGYYKDEGLDVTVEPVNGGSESIGAIVSGRAQFATQSTEVIYTSRDTGIKLKGFYCEIPKDFISIAVLPTSGITSVKQLKGKTIGTLAIGGDPQFEAEAVLAKYGLKTTVDYKFLAVGAGEPALHALETGQVQALNLWAMVYAGYEANGGPKLRTFAPTPIPKFDFEHTTVAMTTTLNGNPDMVRSMSRAFAKSLVFLSAAKPAEIVKLFYTVYPSARPAGKSTSEAIKYGEYVLKSVIPYMDFETRVTKKTVPLGSATSAAVDAYRDLLYTAAVIKKKLPASTYFTNKFIHSADDFDYASIIKDAKSFTA